MHVKSHFFKEMAVSAGLRTSTASDGRWPGPRAVPRCGWNTLAADLWYMGNVGEYNNVESPLDWDGRQLWCVDADRRKMKKASWIEGSHSYLNGSPARTNLRTGARL
jgi:hypothetical protein